MGRHLWRTDRICAIVLARLSSSRLPGKALMHIEGKEVLTYIVERLQQVLSSEQICIATSDDPSDDAIAAFALKSGIGCFRGSLSNVAGRFLEAARMMGSEFAIRINGDNIFVDTDLLRSMIAMTMEGKYDFVTNVKGRSYPKGMSIEIVKTAYFESVFKEIEKETSYREHVTLYLYDHPGTASHYYVVNEALPDAAGIQLALDTEADLARTRMLISRFTKPHWTYNLPEILQMVRTHE